MNGKPQMTTPQPSIVERVARVRARLTAACARAGREAASVRIVAVSKTHPPESVEAAAAAGLTLFGENRVQEAAAKIPLCSSQLEWHLVGHLQSNKARAAVRLFQMIHSVDSADLLRRLDRLAAEEGRRLPVLLCRRRRRRHAPCRPRPVSARRRAKRSRREGSAPNNVRATAARRNVRLR